MSKWYKNEMEESFYLEKAEGKLICSLHPKETKEYAFFLLNRFFEDKDAVQQWYTTKNFWYGDISPQEMTNKELFMRIFQMINGVYI